MKKLLFIFILIAPFEICFSNEDDNISSKECHELSLREKFDIRKECMKLRDLLHIAGGTDLDTILGPERKPILLDEMECLNVRATSNALYGSIKLTEKELEENGKNLRDEKITEEEHSEIYKRGNKFISKNFEELFKWASIYQAFCKN